MEINRQDNEFSLRELNGLSLVEFIGIGKTLAVGSPFFYLRIKSTWYRIGIDEGIFSWLTLGPESDDLLEDEEFQDVFEYLQTDPGGIIKSITMKSGDLTICFNRGAIIKITEDHCTALNTVRMVK